MRTEKIMLWGFYFVMIFLGIILFIKGEYGLVIFASCCAIVSQIHIYILNKEVKDFKKEVVHKGAPKENKILMEKD